MPSLRPTEIGYIDRPDHPALVGPGCTEKARRAFVTGLVGGVVLGAVWGVATAYKCKFAGREFTRNVGRSMLHHGFAFSLGGYFLFALQCY